MTREGKCKDGWRLSMRSIFRVSPHQPECAASECFQCFGTTTESRSSWCSVLFVCLLILNWCQCSVHKHLLKSCCFVKLPPHHTEHTPRPSTSHRAYYLLFTLLPMISIIHQCVYSPGVWRRVSSTHQQEALMRTGRRISTQPLSLRRESQTLSFSLWPLVWQHYIDVLHTYNL